MLSETATVLFNRGFLSPIQSTYPFYELELHVIRSAASAYFPITIASFVVLSTLSLCFRRPRSNATSPTHPLTALLHFISPACSLWPRTYTNAAKRGQSSSKTIRISLRMLINDVISGKIELRSPEDDLRRLLEGNGKLEVDGWVLLFSLGLLWPSVFWSWIKSGLYSGSYKPLLPAFIPNSRHTPSTASRPAEQSEIRQSTHSSAYSKPYISFTSPRKHAPDSRERRASSSAPFPPHHQKQLESTDTASRTLSVLPVLLPSLPSQILQKLAIATTLDFTPHAHVETALLEFQSAVLSGKLALLEFTGCEQRVSMWSKAWILLAMPFLYSTRVFPPSLPNIQRSRAVFPFANTLPWIFTLLESSPSHCTILSVQNVSSQYADLLNDYARTLEGSTVRERLIAGFDDKEVACRAWRAEMLWARWEAACYASGSLARWVVCVKRPTQR